MGPQESYRDKHQGAYHALFRTKINDLHEDYIRPQENGSHFDCDYVVFSAAQFGIAAAAEKPFSFNASCYTHRRSWRTPRITMNWRNPTASYSVLTMH